MALTRPGGRTSLFDRLPATPARLFWQRVAETSDSVALREKALGIWRSFTWADYGESVRLAAHAMADAGVGRGDVISVLSENRPEWMYCDIAAISIGAIGNGIYTTSAPPQVAYVLRDSRTRIVFVEDEEQLDKVLEVRADCPDLLRIVVIDPTGLREFDDPMVETFAAFLERGAALRAADPDFVDSEVAKGRPDDTAILIYTSGTTGRPKAAMITNDNLIFQIGTSPTVAMLNPRDEILSFLPLCHIAERNFALFFPIAHGNVVNFAESPETLFGNLRELSPTAVFAPPRLWEKMYSTVTLTVKDAPPFQRWAYGRALAIGNAVAASEERGEKPGLLAGLFERLFARPVLYNVRAALGLNRIQHALTGAAPVAPDLIRWFRALGIRLREGYGLTESVGLVTMMPPGQTVPGSCGTPPDGIELRLSERGEVLVRGRNVFRGYLNKPKQTAEALDADGWLHTGDVGELGSDGHLRITDRLKDVIITEGGKNITPSEIENRLKFSPFIADAVVFGDRRKYLTCLVMIDYDNVAKFAQDNRVPFTNYGSLCKAPEVDKLIDGEIRRVNAGLSRVEQIKNYRLIDIELTAEDEELTPTMKLKRSLIGRKYAHMIDAMY